MEMKSFYDTEGYVADNSASKKTSLSLLFEVPILVPTFLIICVLFSIPTIFYVVPAPAEESPEANVSDHL